MVVQGLLDSPTAASWVEGILTSCQRGTSTQLHSFMGCLGLLAGALGNEGRLHLAR